MKTRPEAPELDEKQIADLKAFLAKRTPAQLAADLAQTVKGAEQAHPTANLSKAFIAVKDAIDKAASK